MNQSQSNLPTCVSGKTETYSSFLFCQWLKILTRITYTDSNLSLEKREFHESSTIFSKSLPRNWSVRSKIDENLLQISILYARYRRLFFCALLFECSAFNIASTFMSWIYISYRIRNIEILLIM